MKIGFVCPDDLSTVIFTKSFVTKLKQNGIHNIYTISPIVFNYLKEIEGFGSSHITIRMNRYFSPINDLRYSLAIYKICRRKKFDIVINWTTKPNVYGTISEKLAGVPKIVCAIRGLGGPFLPQYNIKGKALKFCVAALYKLACKLSDKVWFTNKGDIDFFLNNGLVDRKKVILTKNALNITEYSLSAIKEDSLNQLRKEFQLMPDDKVVVMVARLIWSKGIREFAEASDILRHMRPDVKFILVAPVEEGQLDTVPVSYIREKERSGNLLWVGFREDVKEIYSLSDVAVLPSFYNEGGYPRALLEPMAFGKPVITTDLPQCRGPVEAGKNGYLVPPRDSKALADAIELLICDDKKMKHFGEYSRMKIEKEFNDRQVVDNILKEIGLY